MRTRSAAGSKYGTRATTPEYSNPVQVNIIERDEMFVSAQAIMWIELSSEEE